MNARRPTDAAGESWRKWGDRPPVDPLHVDQVAESNAYWIGRHDGIMSQPRWRRLLLVTAILLVGAFLVGVGLGYAMVRG